MTYYVQIKDVADIRRQILEGSKETVGALKRYQRLLDIRDEKKEVVQDLQRSYGELQSMIGTVDAFLPEKTLKEVQEFLPKEPKQQPQKKGKKEPEKKAALPSQPQKQKSELERLDEAMAKIEERLSKL